MGQFVVSFSGSLGFIPHVNGKKVRVLLPLDPHGWKPNEGTLVPPHRAFMKFEMSSLANESSRRPDFIYQENRVEYGICFLKDETLTLPPSSDALTLDRTAIADPEHPSPGDQGSVFWIANMKDFCNVASLNRALLTDLDATALAAIIDIVAGRMETESVSSGPPYTVDPPPDTGDYQQCLAEGVNVSSSAAGPYVIESNKNGRLVLQDVSAETSLQIFNEVLDDVLLPEAYRRPKGQKDYDFELLYNLTGLTATDPKHRHLPFRITFTHGTTGCKPAMFAPQAF